MYQNHVILNNYENYLNYIFMHINHKKSKVKYNSLGQHMMIEKIIIKKFFEHLFQLKTFFTN